MNHVFDKFLTMTGNYKLEPDPDGTNQQVAVIMTGKVYRDAGLKHSKHPEVEGLLYDNLCQINKHNLRDDVRRMAINIAIRVKDKEFKASVEWLDNFMRRFCLSKKKMGFHSINMLKTKPSASKKAEQIGALAPNTGLTQEEVLNTLGFSNLESGSDKEVTNGKDSNENGFGECTITEEVGLNGTEEKDPLALSDSENPAEDMLADSAVNGMEENNGNSSGSALEKSENATKKNADKATNNDEQSSKETSKVGEAKNNGEQSLKETSKSDDSKKKKDNEKDKEDKSENNEDDEGMMEVDRENESSNAEGGSDEEEEERDTSNTSDTDADSEEVMSVTDENDDDSQEKSDRKLTEEEEKERKKSKQEEDEIAIVYDKRENKYLKKNREALVKKLETTVVRCSSCFEQVNHQLRGLVYTHPVLGIFICKRCRKYYGKGKFCKDDDGYDEYCRLCAEGGDLLCCEQEGCFNGFCKRCIKRLLGRTELREAEKAKKWACYVCDKEAMMEVRALHRIILENLKNEEEKKSSLSRKELYEKEIKSKFAILKKSRIEKAQKSSPEKPSKGDKKAPKPKPDPWLRDIIDNFTEMLEVCMKNVVKIDCVWLKHDFSKELTVKTGQRIQRQLDAMEKNFAIMRDDIQKELLNPENKLPTAEMVKESSEKSAKDSESLESQESEKSAKEKDQKAKEKKTKDTKKAKNVSDDETETEENGSKGSKMKNKKGKKIVSEDEEEPEIKEKKARGKAKATDNRKGEDNESDADVENEMEVTNTDKNDDVMGKRSRRDKKSDVSSEDDEEEDSKDKDKKNEGKSKDKKDDDDKSKDKKDDDKSKDGKNDSNSKDGKGDGKTKDGNDDNNAKDEMNNTRSRRTTRGQSRTNSIDKDTSKGKKNGKNVTDDKDTPCDDDKDTPCDDDKDTPCDDEDTLCDMDTTEVDHYSQDSSKAPLRSPGSPAEADVADDMTSKGDLEDDDADLPDLARPNGKSGKVNGNKTPKKDSKSGKDDEKTPKKDSKSWKDSEKKTPKKDDKGKERDEEDDGDEGKAKSRTKSETGSSNVKTPKKKKESDCDKESENEEVENSKDKEKGKKSTRLSMRRRSSARNKDEENEDKNDKEGDVDESKKDKKDVKKEKDIKMKNKKEEESEEGDKEEDGDDDEGKKSPKKAGRGRLASKSEKEESDKKRKRKDDDSEKKPTAKRNRKKSVDDSDDSLLGIGSSSDDGDKSSNENTDQELERRKKDHTKEKKKKPPKKMTALEKKNKSALNALLASDSDAEEEGDDEDEKKTKVKKGKKESKDSKKESKDSKTVVNETSDSEEEKSDQKNGKKKGKVVDDNEKAKDALLNSDSDYDLELEDKPKPKCKKKFYKKSKESCETSASDRRKIKLKAQREKLTEEERENLEEEQLNGKADIRIEKLSFTILETLKEDGCIDVTENSEVESLLKDQEYYDGDGEEEESDEEFSRLMKFNVNFKPGPKSKKKFLMYNSDSENSVKKAKKKKEKEKKKKEGLLDIDIDKEDQDEEEESEEEEDNGKKNSGGGGIGLNEKLKKNLLQSSDEDGNDDEEEEEEEQFNPVEEKAKKKHELDKKKRKEKEENGESQEENEESQDEEEEKKVTKKGYVKLDISSDEDFKDEDKEEEEEESSDEEDDSDFEESPRKRRTFQLSSSDSESEGKGKKKRKKAETSEYETEDEQEDEKPKNKRKRIKKVTSSSDEGGDDEEGAPKEESPSKHKKIRRVIKDEDLLETTKNATQEEEERRKRIADRQKKFNSIFQVDVESEQKDIGKLVLDFDADSKKELVSVHEKLVKFLKPHQFKGVKFMWDSTVESVEMLEKEKPGSGCILAHCMGLGKTLQVITFIHTLMTSKRTNNYVQRVMVCCPVNTVYNWVGEFKNWLKGKMLHFDVTELVSAKDLWGRAYRLDDWYREGGVIIMGYDMFRNLSNEKCKRYKGKMKEIFQKSLVDPGPDLIVCDEGHILKNEKTALSVAINKIKTMRRIVLTGTPLQNNLKEYHCMIQFVKPNLLGTKKEFMNRFVNPIEQGQCAEADQRDVRRMKRRAHILHNLLEGCVQRFDYTVLKPFLPPKFEFVISVQLSEIQCKLYRYYLDNLAQGGPKRHGSGLFVDYGALSRVWTHPKVLQLAVHRAMMKDDEDEDMDFICDDTTEDESSEDERSKKKKKKATKKKGEDDDEGNVDEIDEVNKDETGEPGPIPGLTSEGKVRVDWWKKVLAENVGEDFEGDDYLDRIELSGKLILLLEILRECCSIGDKVLVFSQSLLALDMMEEFLEYIDQGSMDLPELDEPLTLPFKKWKKDKDYFRLDGSTNADNRKQMCNKFNNQTNERCRLFLISTRAGGLGINLVAANRVIIFDSSWNPSHDSQSIFRVYRFGQNKPCYVYRFVAQGTMEEKIYSRQVTKMSTSLRVVDEHQIKRYFKMADLQQLYEFTPADKDKRETPAVPEDQLLAELLKRQKDWIVSYHEHDSLLENQTSEELSEEERKAAWDDYENEKKGFYVQNQRNSVMPVVGGMAMGSQSGLPSVSLAAYSFEGVVNTIKAQNPNLSQNELCESVVLATKQIQRIHLNHYQRVQGMVYNLKNPMIAPEQRKLLPFGNHPEMLPMLEQQLRLLEENIQRENQVINHMSQITPQNQKKDDYASMMKAGLVRGQPGGAVKKPESSNYAGRSGTAGASKNASEKQKSSSDVIEID